MTTDPTTTDAGDTDLPVEHLVVDITQALALVASNLDLIEALTDTRKPAILGFATPEGKEAAARLFRVEREARRDNQAKGRPTGSGDVAAPGNIAAVSLAAEFHATLQHALRRCLRTITEGRPLYVFLAGLQSAVARSRGLGVLTEQQTRQVQTAAELSWALEDYALAVNLEPSTSDLVQLLDQLVRHVHHADLLLEVLDDLHDLNDQAEKFLDGTDRTTLKAGCPHCDRKTLTVYFADRVIRCEPRRWEHCICSDPLCECKLNPFHRHVWHAARPRTASDSWWALSNRLAAADQATLTELPDRRAQ